MMEGIDSGRAKKWIENKILKERNPHKTNKNTINNKGLPPSHVRKKKIKSNGMAWGHTLS